MLATPASPCSAPSSDRPATAGQELSLAVTGLITDGRGLARHNGMAVFIADALPGETVLARITRVKRNLAEAERLRVISPAPGARPAPCPHNEDCGGCAWQSMPYAEQLVWKDRFVQDALTRIGHIAEPPMLPPLASPEEWGYRNKMEFAFGYPDPGSRDVAPDIGLRRRASHGLVPVTGCLLQSALAMRLVAAARQYVSGAGLSARGPDTPEGFWRFLVIREPLAGGCLVEAVLSPHPEALRHGEGLAEALGRACPEMTGFVLSERASSMDVAYGERLVWSRGVTELEESVNGTCFSLGTGAFFQVNTPAAALLYEEVTRLAAMGSTDTVWDLYCGVGSIGLYVASRLPVRRLVGVEYAKQAVALAAANARRLLPDMRSEWHAGDATRLVARLARQHGKADKAFRPDLVIIDPPRSGIDAGLANGLLALKPDRILYVSCDPATLARDIARLRNGYTLTSARAVDLFPQTPHVESVCLLTRM